MIVNVVLKHVVSVRLNFQKLHFPITITKRIIIKCKQKEKNDLDQTTINYNRNTQNSHSLSNLRQIKYVASIINQKKRKKKRKQNKWQTNKSEQNIE